jgi:hypothetical protein
MYVTPEENAAAVQKAIAKPIRLTTDDGRVFEVVSWIPDIGEGEAIIIEADLRMP